MYRIGNDLETMRAETFALAIFDSAMLSIKRKPLIGKTEQEKIADVVARVRKAVKRFNTFKRYDEAQMTDYVSMALCGELGLEA